MSHDLLEWSEKVTIQQTMEKKKKNSNFSKNIESCNCLWRLVSDSVLVY